MSDKKKGSRGLDEAALEKMMLKKESGKAPLQEVRNGFVQEVEKRTTLSLPVSLYKEFKGYLLKHELSLKDFVLQSMRDALEKDKV